MISDREIKEHARKLGVPPSTIERDYVQNWFLAFLHQTDMVLKGGTGIRKVFIENYRFSDDLDFTLRIPMTANRIRTAILDAMNHVRDESGIQFEENIGLQQTKNGFKATTWFRILNRGTASPIKIDLDLTSADCEQILLPVHERRVFHHYSDELEVFVTSYALEEIMAEKIRSAFQRTRCRDIYDIDQIAGLVDHTSVCSILSSKCEYKSVRVDPEGVRSKRDQYAALWQISLAHQIREIPDFDAAFENVVRIIENYSSADGDKFR